MRHARVHIGRYTRQVPAPRHARGQTESAEPRSRDEVIGARYGAPGAATRYAKSYEGWQPSARYHCSRTFLVSEALAWSEGDVLDVGSGPGVTIRRLIDSRPNDFRITALERSHSMVKACAHRIAGAHNARALVGRAEAMPFSDESFDVVLALGILEYVDVEAALTEVSRVTRADGLVLATMLNPISPYRFFEWHIYKPARRLVRRMKNGSQYKLKRRDPVDSTVQTYSARSLSRMMATAGLRPVNVLYYDVNFLVPPLDRYLRRWTRRWQQQPGRTVGRGWKKWMGSAYMVVARKTTRTASLTTPEDPWVTKEGSQPSRTGLGHRGHARRCR